MPVPSRLSREKYRECIKVWFEYNRESSLLSSLRGMWDIASLRHEEDVLSLKLVNGWAAAAAADDDAFYDKDLSLDDCTVDNRILSSSLTGQMDICLHPIYQVPCPYVIITDTAHGNLVCMSDIKKFFGRDNEENIDKFIQEEHPITGATAYTLQLCGVYEKFEQICSDITVSNNENIQNIVYFNAFLSLVFEAVGLKLRCTNSLE